MTLNELNASITLLEYWMQDVTKEMKKKGTEGEYTEHCKQKGYTKATYACIKDDEKQYVKDKEKYEAGEMSKANYDKSLRIYRKAILAKNFKNIAKKKKK